MKQLLQVVGMLGKLFLPVGAKTCFGGEAPTLQGRQECRPSGGPATLLSPMVGMEICFFPSGPKLVLVGRLPCCRGDKSVAHPADRRHSCRRWWVLKSVSSSPGQNLFWWGGSHAAGATRVSPIRRTGDTPVADGGPGNLFLPVGAKTCFGGEAPMLQGRQECRPSGGPATLLSPMVGLESCFLQSGPKLVLVGRLLGNWICGGGGVLGFNGRNDPKTQSLTPLVRS